MAAEKIKIKLESATSEFNVELKMTAKVKDLIEIVKKTWGSDGYITLHYGSTQMESGKSLSAYNIEDGSIIQVKYFAEAP